MGNDWRVGRAKPLIPGTMGRQMAAEDLGQSRNGNLPHGGAMKRSRLDSTRLGSSRGLDSSAVRLLHAYAMFQLRPETRGKCIRERLRESRYEGHPVYRPRSERPWIAARLIHDVKSLFLISRFARTLTWRILLPVPSRRPSGSGRLVPLV